ncbi:hypothetical protein [Vulcanisaeta souniana]|uniref:hypothetical protein n=1 Tax=Vulcanisaeta souniana TaxID=164452 RepID=UPI0006D2B14D|nr:hypothetical protein [Vulcanisaeta souniana]
MVNAREVQAYRDLPGMPRLVMGNLRDFVNEVVKDNSLPRWRGGELYLEIHRGGVYTNGIRLKQLVRALETRLKELETFSVIAGVRRSMRSFGTHSLRLSIMIRWGATSTKAVYEEIINELEEDLKNVNNELMNVLRGVLGAGSFITIVNSLPWTRREVVMVREELSGIPTQRVDGGYLALVDIPALAGGPLRPAVAIPLVTSVLAITM